MSVVRTRVALAVQHESLVASHVTEVLGIEPSESFEAGDPYARGSRAREHAHWALDSPADGDLEAQLRALLERLVPVQDGLRRLSGEGYRLTWTCYVEEHAGDGAVSLSASLLADLGALPVGLWLDTFADEPAEG